jgi:PAS domain S-box-containing protein
MKNSRRGAAPHKPMSSRITPAQLVDVSGLTDWNDSEVRRRIGLLVKVAQTTASALVITDTEGVIIWVNAGFTRMTGYSFEEALGRKPGQLLQGPKTDPAEVARISAALRARERVSAELINYTKDHRRYWVGMKIEPIFAADGTFEGFMAIQADITSRHEERISMEQLTHRFNLATRAARLGVFERDSNGEISWWSEMTWEIFGQDRATFKPSTESWLGLIHPDDRERMRELAAGLIRGLETYDWHYRIIHPNGEVRHIRSVGAVSETQDGIGKRFSGISMDVTWRVRAEEREKEMQQQLLESSHQAGMAQIATGVLHNVGNILNSLGIANNTARRELKTLRVEQLEQAASLLRSNRDTLADFLAHDERGRHLPDYLCALSDQIAAHSRAIHAELETTEQLLRHLSDVVAVQQQLAHAGGRREMLHVDELIETALLVQAAEFRQIEIVREYEELPTIVSDRHKLLQILVNLLSNARHAVQAGDRRNRRILLKLARDGDHVRVTVEDTGIGMTEEVLSQIWRFGFTTKKNGHGFGLHNSANAAQEIGATLTAHSDGVGQGSRFVLRIPLGTEPMLSGEAA